MKKNRVIIVLFSILVIVISCRKTERFVNYCGFNYSRLTPDSICIPNLHIVSRYSDDNLVSLKFYSGRNLIRQDTVVSASGVVFLVSESSLGTDTFFRISAVLNDTARTFVFHLANSIYDLAFMETILNATSFKVDFFESRTFTMGRINSDVLSNIKNRYNKFKPIEDYLIIDYQYSDNSLTYEVLEFHSYLRGYGKMASEEIKNNGNCMYLDMSAVEDRTIVFLYKQVNALMHSN